MWGSREETSGGPREESEVSGEKTGWGMLLVRGTTHGSKHGVRKRKWPSAPCAAGIMWMPTPYSLQGSPYTGQQRGAAHPSLGEGRSRRGTPSLEQHPLFRTRSLFSSNAIQKGGTVQLREETHSQPPLQWLPRTPASGCSPPAWSAPPAPRVCGLPPWHASSASVTAKVVGFATTGL